jgi:antitoxin HigA-1
MNRMYNPPHPGETLKEDVLPALGLTVTDAAAQLGVSRMALSRVINGHASISAELAIRLAQWLGGRAEVWLRQQMAYDLWHAERKSKIKVKPARWNREAFAQELAEARARMPIGESVIDELRRGAPRE